MNNKTLVYPFDQQFLPIIQTQKYPSSLNIAFCVSPKGWGFTGKDIGYVAYEEHQGIQVTDDYEAALAEVESVIFSTYQKFIDRDQSILPKIHQAIVRQKKIYCCLPLTSSELELFLEESAKHGAMFMYYGNEKLDAPLPLDLIIKQKSLQPITTTIVAVTSLAELSGKFALQLKFTDYMRRQGYKVSIVTSNSYAAFVQEHPIPAFLFNTTLSESDKILSFNAYIKYIQDQENPDLIVISIPGGLLPVSSDETSWFGITAYEITRAVTPDASFLISYFENFELSDINDIVTMLNNRFSLSINAIVFNNTMTEFSEEKYVSYIKKDVVKESKVMQSTSLPIFGLHNTEECFSYMLRTLTQYSDVSTL